MAEKEKENQSNALMINDTYTNPANDEADTRPDTFEEFTSNTTLHGVRFVGDHTFFLPRRLIWLGIVLLSASIFTVQVVDRVEYYLSSPITVNFKVNYNRSLKFPAITICNQNLFRISEAYRQDLDYTVEKMFGDPDYKGNGTVAIDTPLDVLYTVLAHTKEDFIFSCKWGPYECSSENFTMTLTSHGVCYTFNKVNSLEYSLEVEASGVDHGLQLVLNTEKYEKMDGPHKTDGIKLIATDQSEIPSVEEIGIAISAGAHAFVGLEVLSLKNLEPPYGPCGTLDLLSTDRYTYDSCMLECKTNIIVEACKCRDYYMPDLTGDTRMCTVDDFFQCLYMIVEMFNAMRDAFCDCPNPCVYNIYEPSVSYATKDGWESIWIGDYQDLEHKYELRQSFREANEFRTRQNINGLSSLRVRVSNAIEQLSYVGDYFQYHADWVAYDEFSMSRFNQDTLNASALRDDLYKVQLFIVEKHFIRNRGIMEEESLGVLCQSYREFLSDIYNNVNYLRYSDELLDRNIPYLMLNGLLSKRLYIAKIAKNAYLALIEAYKIGRPIYDPFVNRTDWAVAIPKVLLRESLYADDYSDYMLDVWDIDRIDEKLKGMKNISNELFYNENRNVDDLLTLGGEFNDACEIYLDRKSLFYSWVIERPAKILKQRKEKLAFLIDKYKSAYDSVANHITDIQNVMKDTDCIMEMNETLNSIISYIKNGLRDNVTKYDIALEVSGYIMQANRVKFELLLANTKGLVRGVTAKLSALVSSLYEIWEHLLAYNDDNTQHDAYYNYTQLLLNYSDMRQHINDSIEPMKKRFIELSELIDTQERATLQHITEVVEEMKTYIESNRVENDFYKENFLEVDIYFKELRSEQIDQQKAYDEFALLCDIGGSMGLFIGGSAITFFEVIDFLVICFVHKVCKKRR